MIGTILAQRYLVTAELGSGGMGTVYLATDLRTGGPVAVKTLHTFLARRPEYVARLRREAEIAASLTSPRIVRVTDVGQHEGAPFLVMEYVPGETLADLLEDRGSLPVDQALALCLEVARALAAAHHHGIVHRDLKPENVKLVDGQVKVLDFGIARVEADAPITATGHYLGTPGYSAPERVSGLGDIRSDLYSLGVILFVLVEGYPPFAGVTPLDVLRRQETAQPPSMTDDVPPPVRDIVRRCLARRPEDRYQTPREAIEALEAALHALGRSSSSMRPAGAAVDEREPIAPAGATVTLGLRSGESSTAAATVRSDGVAPVTSRAGNVSSPPSVRRRLSRRVAAITGTGLAVATVVLAVAMVALRRGTDPAPSGQTTGTTAGTALPSTAGGSATGTAPNASTTPVAARPAEGAALVLAGSGAKGHADGAAAQARFDDPAGLAVDAAGNVYVADKGNHRLRKVTPDGLVITIAGSGIKGFADGSADEARFAEPSGIVSGPEGDLWVADGGNHRLRRVTAAGAVSTLAGTGDSGAVDGGAEARFFYPAAVARDAAGTLYVADYANDSIRKVTPGGQVTTLAGGRQSGFADGVGNEARFNGPTGIAVDAAGNVLVADSGNHRIRRVTPAGIVTTLAGSGVSGYVDGPAGAAAFNAPLGVAVDRTGNIYVADTGNHAVRRLAPDGTVTTVAGKARPGAAGPVAVAADLASPAAVAVDAAGNVYASDAGDRIWLIRAPR